MGGLERRMCSTEEREGQTSSIMTRVARASLPWLLLPGRSDCKNPQHHALGWDLPTCLVRSQVGAPGGPLSDHD